VYKLVS